MGIMACIQSIKAAIKCKEIVPKLIMSIFVSLCAAYAFLESKACFENKKLFGAISKDIYIIIEISVAFLILIFPCIKKKWYAIFLFSITVLLAGISLFYTIAKIVWFSETINKTGVKHKLIHFMYFTRAFVELFIQAFICKTCFSYKDDIEGNNISGLLNSAGSLSKMV